MQPAIAIVTANTLAGIGLSDIIRRMMPGADTSLYTSCAALMAAPEAEGYYHYFVSAEEVIAGAAWFLSRQHKTIVLLHGTDAGHLPQGFHTLNVCQSETMLVRDIMGLAHRSHTAHGSVPEAVRHAECCNEAESAGGPPRLTPRERQVLQGVVTGKINKEIAKEMGVSLATVITHRKNLAEKLGTRSVSAMTIFAVAHGMVRSEDI